MNTRKAPVVNISETVHRVVLMFIVIILGVILSYTTAEAGVKADKFPFSKTAQKKKNRTYSCKVLAEKQRNSSNIVVKTNTRRPKWR
jgi:hypothetical protein